MPGTFACAVKVRGLTAPIMRPEQRDGLLGGDELSVSQDAVLRLRDRMPAWNARCRRKNRKVRTSRRNPTERTGAGDGSGERRGIGREDMKSVSRGSRLCGALSLCTVLSSASGRCGQGVPPARLPGEAVFCRAAARGLCESAVRTISPGHSAGARERRHRGGSADLGGRGSVERLTGQSGAGWGRGRSAAGWPVRIRKVALGAGL